MSLNHVQPVLARGKSSTSLKDELKKKQVKKFTAGKLASHSRNGSYGKNLSKLTRIRSHEASEISQSADDRPIFLRSKSSCEVLTKANRSKSNTKLNTLVLRNKSLTNLQRIKSKSSALLDSTGEFDAESAKSDDSKSKDEREEEEEEVDSFDDDEKVLEIHDAPEHIPSPLTKPATVPEELEESAEENIQNQATIDIPNVPQDEGESKINKDTGVITNIQEQIPGDIQQSIKGDQILPYEPYSSNAKDLSVDSQDNKNIGLGGDDNNRNGNINQYPDVKPDSLHKLYGANLLLSQSTGIERSINANPQLTQESASNNTKKSYDDSSLDFYGKLRDKIQQNEEEQANLEKFNRVAKPSMSNFSESSVPQSSGQNEELRPISSNSSLIFQPSTANLSKVMYKQLQRQPSGQTTQQKFSPHTRIQPSFVIGSQNNLNSLSTSSGTTAAVTNNEKPVSNVNDSNLPNDFSQFLNLSGTTVETRTQQKLWLQRENSILEISSSKVNNVNNLLMSYATNSQFRTEFEKYSREYLNIRRYNNPMVDSLGRLKTEDEKLKLKSKKIRSNPNTDNDNSNAAVSTSINGQSLSSFDAFCPGDVKGRLKEISLQVNNMWQKSYDQYTNSQSSSSASVSSTGSNIPPPKRTGGPIGILNNSQQNPSTLQQQAQQQNYAKSDYFHSNSGTQSAVGTTGPASGVGAGTAEPSNYVQATQPYIAPPTTRAQRQNGRLDPSSTNLNVTAANNLH